MSRRFVLREHVPLAPFCTLGVGGAARWFARADTQRRRRAPFISGARSTRSRCSCSAAAATSSIADEGFDGLVLQMAVTGVTMTKGPAARS